LTGGYELEISAFTMLEDGTGDISTLYKSVGAKDGNTHFVRDGARSHYVVRCGQRIPSLNIWVDGGTGYQHSL